jgi:multiple sugar transport system ATP-binding protein
MSAVTLRNIRKDFGADAKIINGVDLRIEAGEFVVFVGPSGSGKSTLLRIIAGLEDASDGELFIGDEPCTDVPASQRGIAMVFQSYALYPHMTVYENMAFALRMAGTPKQEVLQRVERSAAVLQISHLLDRKPKTLSGGQRQRVAIGRAIVREPRVFLFDEPLSNLDAALRQDMRVELSKLHQELGATMVYVTHDQVEAMTLAQRIVVFDGGVVQQVGTPAQLYENPSNLFVAGFLGAPKMNFLKGRLQSAGPRSAAVELPGVGVVNAEVDASRATPGSEVTLGIRPEHLGFGMAHDITPPGAVDARLDLVEYLGDHQLVYATLTGSGQPLCAKLAGPAGALRGGDKIRLHLAPRHCQLFDTAGHACPRIQ